MKRQDDPLAMLDLSPHVLKTWKRLCFLVEEAGTRQDVLREKTNLVRRSSGNGRSADRPISYATQDRIAAKKSTY
jgi:hypothetical protein